MPTIRLDSRRRRLRASVVGIALATGAAAAATVAGGCEALETLETLASATSQQPSAKVSGARVTDLSLDGATMLFDVVVTNPYSVPLPLTDLAYRLTSDNHAIASGTADPGGTIPASGSRTVALPARVEFADLLGALSGIRPGVLVPYEADVTLGVDAPAVGRLDLPLAHRGELPVPAVPEVTLDRVEWEAPTLNEARARLHLGVRNTNAFRVDLPELDAALTLAGRRVGDTRLAQPLALAAGDAGVAEIPLSFSPARFGMAAFQMLTGSGGGYALDGQLAFDTPYGRIDAPLHAAGTTSFVR